jgi:hypothetical protein
MEVTGKRFIKNSQFITIKRHKILEKRVSNTSKYTGQVDTTKACKTSKRSDFHENCK